MLSSSGNTLGSLTVDIASAGSVSLGSNATVAGTLALSGGSLNLNGQSLTIGGAIAPTGTGSITGNVLSNITFNGTGSAGTLVLTPLSQAINNLTMNIGSSGVVALGSAVTVGGTLTLAQGNINLGTNNLTLSPTGTLTGGSAASYVITGDTNGLIMTVANAGAAAMFQVGTLAGYAPVNVTNNSTALGVFTVNAHPGIFANGTSGANIAAAQSTVNTSWDVSSSIVTGALVNLEMFWTTAMQVNGFNNAQAYISHYTGGAWNTSALGAATALTGGAFSLALSGVTSFSPFAVFDKNTVLAIQDIKNEVSFQIYPNPATNLLQISVQKSGGIQTLKVFDAIGNQMVSEQIENALTSLDISKFPSGVYFVQFDNTNTRRFIKE